MKESPPENIQTQTQRKIFWYCSSPLFLSWKCFSRRWYLNCIILIVTNGRDSSAQQTNFLFFLDHDAPHFPFLLAVRGNWFLVHRSWRKVLHTVFRTNLEKSVMRGPPCSFPTQINENQYIKPWKINWSWGRRRCKLSKGKLTAYQASCVSLAEAWYLTHFPHHQDNTWNSQCKEGELILAHLSVQSLAPKQVGRGQLLKDWWWGSRDSKDEPRREIHPSASYHYSTSSDQNPPLNK